MIKYIATDLDGTLFYPSDRKNMICKANLFFVQSFIDNGGKLILVSGRSVDFGNRVISKIGRNAAIIGYNGGIISADGDILKQNPIPKNELTVILTEVNKTYKMMGYMLFCDDGIYFDSPSHNKLYALITKLFNKHTGIYAENMKNKPSEFSNALKNKEVYKLMFFVGITKKKQNEASDLNRILRNAYENLESSWSNQVIEVTSKGCSKGEAIVEFCDLKGIDKSEVAVVGDSGNDISMFKLFFENSFCMEHGPESVHKYAKYTIFKFEDLSRYLNKK